MIKFFRKIRQKLLSENKFSKYLAYAIGEIFLVVIGIMIALQVNNWNEKRKLDTKITKLIEKIEEDVIADIKQMTQTISFYVERESMMNDIIYKEVTAEDYRKFKYYEILFNYSDFNPNTENINKLLQLEESIKPDYLPLIRDIKTLKKRQKYKDLAWNDLQKAFTANVDYYGLSGKDFIFRRDSTNINKTINFYLTDENFLNRVSNYLNKYHNMLYEARTVRGRLVRILVSIKRIMDEYDRNQLITILDEFGLNHFNEIDCNSVSSDYKELHGIRQAPIIFNMTDETLRINISDKYDNTLNDLILEPGVMEVHDNWRGGLRGQGDYSKVVTVYRNDYCIGKFAEEPHGYIIIDTTFTND